VWNEAKRNKILRHAGFHGSMIVYSIGLIAFFNAAHNFGSRISRIAIGISVIAFAAFKFYQLWSGMTDFI